MHDPAQLDPETMEIEYDSDMVGISKTLLLLHGVRTYLAEFLTHPDYAGDLYIPVDAYYSRFAEVCLYHCEPPLFNKCVEIPLRYVDTDLS